MTDTALETHTLAEWRVKRGYTQTSLGYEMHRLDIFTSAPAGTISRWENGWEKPRPRTIALLCAVLEIREEQIVWVVPPGTKVGAP